MRYPKGHREETHARIVDEAARAFRLQGIDGVSIGDLMSRLGLTHGGFYAHFESKDVLVANACQRAAQQGMALLYEGTEGLSRADAFDLVIKRYLSRTHRDHPEQGCAVAAVGSDVRRASPTVQSMFGRVIQSMLDRVRAVLPEGSDGEDDAIGMLALLVGGIVLSRAVGDPAMSERVLRAARRFARGAAASR